MGISPHPPLPHPPPMPSRPQVKGRRGAMLPGGRVRWRGLPYGRGLEGRACGGHRVRERPLQGPAEAQARTRVLVCDRKQLRGPQGQAGLGNCLPMAWRPHLLPQPPQASTPWASIPWASTLWASIPWASYGPPLPWVSTPWASTPMGLHSHRLPLLGLHSLGLHSHGPPLPWAVGKPPGQ